MTNDQDNVMTSDRTEPTRSLGWYFSVWLLTASALGMLLVSLPALLDGDPGELEGIVVFPSRELIIFWVILTAVAVILADTASTLRRAPAAQRVFAYSAAGAGVLSFSVYVWMVWRLKSAHASFIDAGADAVRKCARTQEQYAAMDCLPEVNFPDIQWAAPAMSLTSVLIAMVVVRGRFSWPAGAMIGGITALPGCLVLRFLITSDEVESRIGWSGLIVPLLMFLIAVLWLVRARGIRPWTTFIAAVITFIIGIVILTYLSQAERLPFDALAHTVNDGAAAVVVLLFWVGINLIATHIAWLRHPDRTAENRPPRP
ncbi:hypothetical protein [Oceanobacillus neutriphilus]|uniref:DUF4386 family protein n=1 Tax=Oceanobacillus neutriphilus TaxID=531815 RepID=A0ABQ2NWW2_9BACI|nr:hypothetical protein [Oceanobacillus neutriphilus]GGP12636.1 hypothetical protein GCM10011346_29390 [Oceanobacillus neutriphilus]